MLIKMVKIGSNLVMCVNMGFSSVHVFLAINAWSGDVVTGIFGRPNSESLKCFLRYFKFW